MLARRRSGQPSPQWQHRGQGEPLAGCQPASVGVRGELQLALSSIGDRRQSAAAALTLPDDPFRWTRGSTRGSERGFTAKECPTDRQTAGGQTGCPSVILAASQPAAGGPLVRASRVARRSRPADRWGSLRGAPDRPRCQPLRTTFRARPEAFWCNHWCNRLSLVT